MVKKAKSAGQTDIFGLLEEMEWEDKKDEGDHPDPSTWQVGDIIQVKWGNGEIKEGKFVTRGFWDGRDLECPEFYFLDGGGFFFDFNPYVKEWIRVGHDDSYQPPRKDDLVEKLTKRLRHVPFAKYGRLNAFHQFEHEYPYLSYEYHPYVSEAWEKAIVAVTTEQEVIEDKETFAWTSKPPKFVEDYIANQIFPLKGDQRIKAVSRMRWCKWKCKPRGHENEGWFISSYDTGLRMGYSNPVLIKFISETTQLENLKTFIRYLQYQSNRFEENPPGLFWIEEDGKVLEVIKPLNEQPELIEDDDDLMIDDEEDESGDE